MSIQNVFFLSNIILFVIYSLDVEPLFNASQKNTLYINGKT